VAIEDSNIIGKANSNGNLHNNNNNLNIFNVNGSHDVIGSFNALKSLQNLNLSASVTNNKGIIGHKTIASNVIFKELTKMSTAR